MTPTPMLAKLVDLSSEAKESDPVEAPANRAPVFERSLEDEIYARLRVYTASLKDQAPRDLYGLILPQLERPLLRLAMELADGCQSRAADMLGIHRNTLRVRLQRLGVEVEAE